MQVTYDAGKTRFDVYFAGDVTNVLNAVLAQLQTGNGPQTPEETIATIAELFRLEVVP